MNDKLFTWGESIFSRMTKLANKHQALNIGQGFPDYNPDPTLINLVKDALDGPNNQYTMPGGSLYLRESIAALIARQYGRKLDAESEINIVPGVTFGIFQVIQACIQQGDEVIVFEPAYDSYEPAVVSAGGVVKKMVCQAPLFEVDFNKLKTLISSRTRLIIINNPNNPSTKCWSLEALNQLFELIKNTDCFVVSDEVYEYHQYLPVGHTSIHQIDGLAQRSIVCSSFGKSLHCTGWKMGYLVAPAKISSIVRKAIQYSIFCTNHPIQIAIANYLNDHFDPTELTRSNQSKRDFLTQSLNGSKWRVLPCEGTYFLLLDYSALSDDSSITFAEQLVTKHGVATIPLDAFYSDGYDPKLVRICFAKTQETLDQTLDKLCHI